MHTMLLIKRSVSTIGKIFKNVVFCIRYVKNDAPVKRFLQFIHINRHNSEYLTGTVTNFMSKNSIDISYCRGQSYDNTNNMAGKYTGLQQRILDMNELAIFLPCASHLNE